MCVCVCVCAYACMRVRVYVCVCVVTRACVFTVHSCVAVCLVGAGTN